MYKILLQVQRLCVSVLCFEGERPERDLILEEKEKGFVLKICKFRYIIYTDKNIFSSTLRKESIIL